MNSFKNRLIEAMDMRGIIAADLAEKTGLSKASISHYVNGRYEAKQEALHLIALALNVSEAWLMGLDVPMSRLESDNIVSIKTKTVPLIGNIACGKPIFAAEERGRFVYTSDGVNADFCLRAVGDSMIGARINDGDIVFCVEQSSVDNGEIAAVIIDDEATLKRVYLEKDKLVLAPENPAYAPLVYVGEELQNIRIIGKAVAFQSLVK